MEVSKIIIYVLAVSVLFVSLFCHTEEAVFI